MKEQVQQKCAATAANTGKNISIWENTRRNGQSVHRKPPTLLSPCILGESVPDGRSADSTVLQREFGSRKE